MQAAARQLACIQCGAWCRVPTSAAPGAACHVQPGARGTAAGTESGSGRALQCPGIAGVGRRALARTIQLDTLSSLPQHGPSWTVTRPRYHGYGRARRHRCDMRCLTLPAAAHASGSVKGRGDSAASSADGHVPLLPCVIMHVTRQTLAHRWRHSTQHAAQRSMLELTAAWRLW